MSTPDRIRTSVQVAVDPLTAFEVFTDDIDTWWKRTPMFRFRPGVDATMRLNRDRFVAIFDAATGAAHEIGKVLVWEPGERLVFEWRLTNFAPDEVTEVEVRFAATPGGTEVTLEHRGWGALRPDHPARHGLDDARYAPLLGQMWLEVLRAYRGAATSM